MGKRRAAIAFAALFLAACGPTTANGQQGTERVSAVSATAASGETVLHPADLEKIVPASVFFRGQTAPTQLRNSGGVRFADGAILFAANVDTSGYSSGVQEKYQAYLATEVPLLFGGHRLAPGAYGVGFIAGGKFVAMDLGGNDLLTAPTERDAALRRPTPLQVAAAPGGGYRLYSGRTFVAFSRTAAAVNTK